MLEEYAERLRNKTYHFSADSNFDFRATEAADSINKYNSNQRIKEQIVENTICGFAAEEAIAADLNWTLNPNRFNHKDPNTFVWDIKTSNKELVEVKSSNKPILPGARIYWFLQNNIPLLRYSDALDIAIYCYSGTDDFVNFIIKPALIVNTKTLRDNLYPTKYGYLYASEHALPSDCLRLCE